MSHPRLTVLVVGATGSIGRLVVEEASGRTTLSGLSPAIPEKRADCSRMWRWSPVTSRVPIR